MEQTHSVPPQKIPVANVRPGRNPRRYFDPALMADLENSIRAHGGLLQPVLVRPIEADRFEIVAGERRFRAYKTVYGDQAEIPVLMREMTDEEAAAAALAENTDRTGMTPVEEAEAAARVLGDCQNNRDEAAARLGWSRATLDKRLALMYATDKVRDALQQGKILLGHAELLAVCRREAQDNAIDLLLKQPKLMTVAEFKAHIDKAALVLDTAIFDKSECAGCIHNSGNQSALFAEVISGGRCSNKECFDRKSEEELSRREAGLKEEFQQVRTVRPGENFTVIPLVAEGAKGVGAEQAQACRVCKSFGAVVSAVPDKFGQVYKSVCMDVPCNVRMVAARVKAEKAADETSESPSGPSSGDKPPESEPKGDGNAQAKAKTKASGTAAKAAYPEPSSRVQEYREKLWRAIYKRVVGKLSIADNRAVLLALCVTKPGHIDAHALREAIAPVASIGATATAGTALTELRNLDSAKLGAALQFVAATVSAGMHGMDIKDVVSILRSFEVKIADHWKVSKEFFELLTKNEIDAVCDELGIKAAMGGEYPKALAQSKGDYIQSILSIPDFDYRGRIPKLVTW